MKKTVKTTPTTPAPKTPAADPSLLNGGDLQRLMLAKHRAQLSLSEAKLADSTYKNVLQDIYLKYGLSTEHVINEETGQIILPPPDSKATNAAG